MKLKVDLNRLTNDSNEVGKCIEAMKKQMNVLKTESAHLDQMWDGSTSEVFKKSFNADLKEFEKIVKNLEQIFKYESRARKKYENCEKKVGQIVNRIKV